MAKGLPGADSSTAATVGLVKAASNIFGENPVLWGRYFTSKTTTGSVEYRHKKENPVLAQFGIRLLPIARQTTHVSGSEDKGKTDAVNNVEDILATFDQNLLVSQGGEFLMFLDVEGLPDTGSPSLSVDYYLGWGQTLVDHSRNLTSNAVTIRPCVYARQGDNDTWNALIAANDKGVPCHGGWVARYPSKKCDMPEFDDNIVLPDGLDGALQFDVVLWQYAENCANGAIDCNQTNPNIADIQAALLNKLILPPSG